PTTSAPSPAPTATPPPSPAATPVPTMAPSPTASPTASPDPDRPGAEQVTVYFAREHASGVWVEPEVVPLDEATVAVARAAMEALVGRAPRDPARTTLSAAGASVRGVDVDGDVLVVDFSGLVPPEGVGGSSREAA